MPLPLASESSISKKKGAGCLIDRPSMASLSENGLSTLALRATPPKESGSGVPRPWRPNLVDSPVAAQTSDQHGPPVAARCFWPLRADLTEPCAARPGSRVAACICETLPAGVRVQDAAPDRAGLLVGGRPSQRARGGGWRHRRSTAAASSTLWLQAVCTLLMYPARPAAPCGAGRLSRPAGRPAGRRRPAQRSSRRAAQRRRDGQRRLICSSSSYQINPGPWVDLELEAWAVFTGLRRRPSLSAASQWHRD